MTAEDAAAKLREIFDDLQTRFHDQWEWMDAEFSVQILEAALTSCREELYRLKRNEWPLGDKPNPCAGYSGGGINVYGDEESMKKVKNALWYEPQLREHLKADERENFLKVVEERDRVQAALLEADRVMKLVGTYQNPDPWIAAAEMRDMANDYLDALKPVSDRQPEGETK